MKNKIVIYLWRKLKMIIFKLNPRLGIKIVYRILMGYYPNLKQPKYFNEKIQYLKLFEYKRDIYRYCTDKYLVRDYVKNKQCGEILNKIYKVYKNPNEINFDELPESFALKLNHGCGYNIIVKDKKKLDYRKCIVQLQKWLKVRPEMIYGEPQGKIKDKYIIVEKYLGNNDNVLPKDYKFFCFNGKPKYIMYCDERETGTPKFYYFDLKWNILDFSKESKENRNIIKKPKRLSEMIEYASILSKDFYFVRVDLYNVDEKIYFGELTFSPAAGFDKDLKYISSNGMLVDEILGNELKLPYELNV